MRKVTSFVLALVMLVSGSVMAFAATDTAGTAYEATVNALVENKYASGYPDGSFKPENQISRAEAASIIVKFVGATDEELAKITTTEFTDMDTHKWAIPAVGYAVEKGILSGYTDGTFKPGNNVTYAEMAVMIVNAMDQKNLVSGKWDEGYMAVAKEKGYLDNTVKVDAKDDISVPATRGNVAIMVYNADVRRDLEDATVERPKTPLSNFSGYAYGAVNGYSQVLNEDDEAVYEVEFVFGDGVQYLKTKENYTPADPVFDGSLYVLQVRKGEVVKIEKAANASAAGMRLNKFEELTSGYQEVVEVDSKEIVFVKNGSDRQMVDLNMELYSIYVATNDGNDATSGGAIDGYRPGTFKDIDEDDFIRAYDVTKDDDGIADVIFVLKK